MSLPSAKRFCAWAIMTWACDWAAVEEDQDHAASQRAPSKLPAPNIAIGLGGEGPRRHARGAVDGVFSTPDGPQLYSGETRTMLAGLEHRLLRGLHRAGALRLDVGIVERPIDLDCSSHCRRPAAFDEGIERQAG